MPFSPRFALPFWPSLLVLAMLVLTLNLGFWQLRREAEKQQLVAQREQALARPPVALDEALRAAEPQALTVRVTGQWLAAPAFRLANQSWNGRRGVHWLQWLQLADGRRLLVDRGWAAADAVVPLTAGATVVQGQLYRPGQPWRAPVLDWSQPLVELPVLDLAALHGNELHDNDSHDTDPAGLPYLLRLDAQAAEALQANWSQAGMTPAKHRGYAVTWFSLSAALLLLYGGWLWQQQRART